ncbi:MAG: ABC transporter permease [Bacteroidota bacterium]
MLKNYFKTALRNLIKHKGTSVISLLGFIIGLTSVIFLYFYIENELNYDAFHSDKESIYRVYRTSQDETGETYDIGQTSPPYAEALINDFQGIIQSTVRTSIRDLVVSNGDKRFYEDYVMVADTNFFEFFSYPLKYGDPETVLDDIHNVVLSEELAKKYYNNEDPIGKTISLNEDETFVVAGIFSKPQNKTHIEFDMVISMDIYEPADWFRDWWRNFASTYVKIDPDKASYLVSQFPDFMEKYLGEDFKINNNSNGLTLIPLSDVYFHNARYDSNDSGDKASLYILGSVALAILFIACFNYINLSIAQSYKRAKEIGVRKVLGVNKTRLVFQFMGESMVLLLTALLISGILSTALRDTLNTYFELDVLYNWNDINVILFTGFLFITIVLASGLYPALLLSSFKTLNVLKSDKPLLGKNIFVRKGLIVSQFSLSVFLLVVTMLIYMQLKFMNEKDLGYDSSSVLVIDTDPEIRENYDAFQERLRRFPTIEQVTIASGVPGGFHDNYGINFKEGQEAIRVHTVFSDAGYLKTFGIPVFAGRGFDDHFSTDREEAMMISESAWKATGLPLEEIIGKQVKIPFKEWDRTIIGVYKDYHYKTLKDKVEPQAIIMGEDMNRIAIKMDNSNIISTMKQLEELYAELAPGFPLKSWFLEEDLGRQYEPENRQARVFTVFSGVSIGLACMGVLGLAAFSAQQRQKELGIRKVLGASVEQIIMLISKEFLLLVGIAVIIAIPASWIFIRKWLQDFAYRIEISDHWYLFLMGGSLTALVAFFTIGLKTFKSANTNPADIIRYE